jgi:hypothetical protein
MISVLLGDLRGKYANVFFCSIGNKKEKVLHRCKYIHKMQINTVCAAVVQK